MAISSAFGMGSGMDINGIVSQLVAAEGQPQFAAISRQETAAKAQVSGLGSLKSALSTFQTAVRKLNDVNLFKTHQATSGNESILKVTAGAGSVAGSHTLRVLDLAKAQKSVAAAEFSGASDVVGSGTLTFSVAGKDDFLLTLDGSNNTLAGIRDAINSASDNNGVMASIINVDSGTPGGGTVSKLVLTAKDTGLANAFSVSAVGDAGLSRLDSSTPENYSGQNAVDARILVDGQAVTRSSNIISDVLQGVTLNLQSVASDTDVNIDIKLDNEAIKKTITDFVAAYNTMTSTTANLGKFAGKDGGSNGVLLGDSILRNVRNGLRQQTSLPVSSASSAFNTLKSIGIDIDKDGVMSMDGGALDKALATNLSSVSDVFSSSDGVANRLNTKVMQYLQTGGALDTRQTSLNKQLKTLSVQRESVQLRLDNVQKGLMKQFIAMDLVVGKFQSTGSFLNNQINHWSR
ncbi:MAG: flagellar filament capping protein FliD [Methylobacter sp.]|nr:flagellar filament capping protein FliD [Methylobacter sp.]